MDPKMAEPMTEMRAGPPGTLPATEEARSMKKSPAPEVCKKAPKMRKGIT
jgi:hypothetical protein